MNLLNLPKWKVLDMQESEHDYLVTAEPSATLLACPHCRSKNLARYGKKSPLFMHLPTHGKRVGIRAQAQRYRCGQCKKIIQAPLPDVDERRRATKKLVLYVKKQSLLRPFTDVAGEVGMDEKTVRKLFQEYAEELEAEHQFVTPEWLGIDEIHIKRTPRLVLTNIKESTVFNMLATRKAEVVKRYFLSLPDKETVKLVAIDMWKPYKLVVRATLPKATIVVDKFPVVRLANKALDDYRKDIREELSASDRRKLMHHRFILLRRTKDLKADEKLKLEMWRAVLPALGIAYDLKEAFYAIYDAKDHHEAKKRYWDWLMGVPKDLEPYFRELIIALKNWEAEIFAYFDHRITNAFTESVNSLTRKIESEGRGYSFEALRAKVLYTNGFKIEKRPEFGRLSREGEVNFGPPISTFIRQLERGEI